MDYSSPFSTRNYSASSSSSQQSDEFLANCTWFGLLITALPLLLNLSWWTTCVTITTSLVGAWFASTTLPSRYLIMAISNCSCGIALVAIHYGNLGILFPGRIPTLLFDRTRPNTAAVTIYCRILTEYLAQYYDRSSPCRLWRDTTISGYKRSLFSKHHCTRSPCSLSGIGRIRPKTTSYSLSNGSYTIMNDRIRHGVLRS